MKPYNFEYIAYYIAYYIAPRLKPWASCPRFSAKKSVLRRGQEAYRFNGGRKLGVVWGFKEDKDEIDV